MIYKSMFLTLLLAPFIMADNKTKNAQINIQMRIKELKEICENKEQELLRLSEEIAEKNDFITELRIQHAERLNVDNKDSSDIFAINLTNVVVEKKDINKFLTKELFGDSAYCDPVKLLVLRIMIHRAHLADLVEKLATCMQELTEISTELENLDKEALI